MQEFIKIQDDLSKKVILEDGFGKIERVGGVDLAYNGNQAVAAVVVLDYNSFEVLEEKHIETEVAIPYMPAFLAFREAEPIAKAVKHVQLDILMLDGHGIAHPRGIGVASHVGVLLDVPTIGVAKRILCGEVEGKATVGKPAPLIYKDKQVGYAYRSKEGTNPIYVSPGHKVSLESSLRIALHCIKGHKLPEPARLAHNLASSYKRR